MKKKPPRYEPLCYEGQIFPSIKSLAAHLGISYDTMRDRVKRGVRGAALGDRARLRNRGLKLGYSLADLPEKIQRIAIDLSDCLQISPAEAYAKILEVTPLPADSPLKASALDSEEGEAPMPLEEARSWLAETLGIPRNLSNEKAMAALVQMMEEDGFTPCQIKMRLGLLSIQFEQFKKQVKPLSRR